MTQRKRKRSSNLHLLDGEQHQALGRFQKDLKTALPHMQQMAQDAKRMHQAMIDAPVWRVMDNPRPEDAQKEPELWSVGHAKINYVDNIKTEGTQEK
jgi:hypothetical protein